MQIRRDVADRILIAKDFLGRIRFLPVAESDRAMLAQHILTAHDAAELALAAIASHLGCEHQKSQLFLMDYFDPIRRKAHPDEAVKGRDYFSQLNTARIGIKHNGVFPEREQWHRVGENVYEFVSEWCRKYLGQSLDEFDESALISDSQVKLYYDAATKALKEEKWQAVIENIGIAAAFLFANNRALRGLSAGNPRAEDAIRLAAFGVHGNDFLALQEFLPSVYLRGGDTPETRWNQAKYGHPANWRNDTAQFCLTAFLRMALCIQNAQWIPGPLEFKLIYEHKVTALVDGLELRNLRDLDSSPTPKVRPLLKGEFVRGDVESDVKYGPAAAGHSGSPLLSALGLEGRMSTPVFKFFSAEEGLSGTLEKDKVTVTCVPRKIALEYFPDLVEIPYQP